MTENISTALTTASERSIRTLAQKLQCSVEIKDRRWRLRKYNQCFVGREAVDQMVATKMAPDRVAAVNLGKQMVARDLFHHVVNAHDFEDCYYFYRFNESTMSLDSSNASRKLTGPQLKQLRERLEIRDRRWFLRNFKKCFVGSKAVDVMLKLKLARTRWEAVLLGRQLVTARIIHHVTDGHTFKDQYLFFRFYDDEKHGQQDSYQDAPVGARRRWRFRPTNITLSVILTSKLAKRLEKAVANGDQAAVGAAVSRIRERIERICRRPQRHRAGSTDKQQWVLARERKRRGMQVFHLAGVKRKKMSVPAIKTVGIVSVGTTELIEDLLDTEGGRRRWEPNYLRGSVVESLNPISSRDVRWDAPEPMPEISFSNDSSNSGTSIDLSEFSRISEQSCDPLPNFKTIDPFSHSHNVTSTDFAAQMKSTNSAIDPKLQTLDPSGGAADPMQSLPLREEKVESVHDVSDLPDCKAADGQMPSITPLAVGHATSKATSLSIAAAASPPSTSGTVETKPPSTGEKNTQRPPPPLPPQHQRPPPPPPPKPSQPNAAKSKSGHPTECLRIISNVYERSYPMRPIDVCVLQDSFSCTGGTKVVWEISVLHDKVPQLRGHNRAEVLLKVFMAQPIPGLVGRSRVTIINQIEVKHGKISQRTNSTKSALNKFGKFQERAISHLGNRLSAPASAGYQTGAHASAAMWISSNSSNSESSTDSRSCSSASSIRNDSNDIAGAVDTADVADTSYSPALAAASAPDVAQTSISNFELLAVIGRGGYGKVFQARLRSTGELLALKVMKKTTLSATQAARTMTERTILAEVRHPFIVALKYAFQSSSKLYLAMEFVQGGDLYTLLRRVRVLNIALVRLFASEITLALGHLHSVGVIYRDLKPENVLLGTDGHIKLTDFGLSIWCEEGAHQQCHSFAGTETYMAPELLLQRGHDSAADWWSFGILLCEMSMGRHPFREPHIVANSERKVALSRYCTLRNIANPNVPPRLYTMAPLLRAFVQQLLCKVPKLRLGARGGVEAVMKDSFFSGVDWKAVYAKQATSVLWTAQVWHGNADVSAFDEMFTKEAPVDSVTDDVANSTASSGVFKYTFSNFAFDITADTGSI